MQIISFLILSTSNTIMNLSPLRLSISVTKSSFSSCLVSSSTFSRIKPKPNHRNLSYSTLSRGGGDVYWRINKKSTILFGSGTMFGGSMMFLDYIYDNRCKILENTTYIMKESEETLKLLVEKVESGEQLDPVVLKGLELCYELIDEWFEKYLQKWMFPDTKKAMVSILRVKKIIKTLLSP